MFIDVPGRSFTLYSNVKLRKATASLDEIHKFSADKVKVVNIFNFNDESVHEMAPEQ